MVFATNIQLSEADLQILNEQRALTHDINTGLIQVGAIYLKPKSKLPVAEDWAAKKYLDTKLQEWIDEPELRFTNVGFNLQLGWLDIDIDSSDPEFNRCIQAALRHLGIDARFAFGRRSVGVPTHFFVQLTDDDTANYEELKRFEPREIRVGNERHKVQLRTSVSAANKRQMELSAQQTVVPGSIYTDKIDANGTDISVWWTGDGRIARMASEVASTTSRRVTYRELIRAIAFGSILYLIRPHWQEGNRQNTAIRLFGWLARVVNEGAATNNSEQLADEVFCPIDCDETAEALIELICKETNDTEEFMRKRTYRDARGKLERNPDAKIPGWPSMETLFGVEVTRGLRGVVSPGADISVLSKLIDRYVYNDSNGRYIDRDRFSHRLEQFEYANSDLYQRHKPETIIIGGKPREAFKSFEMSKSRVAVQSSDMFPDCQAGAILRRSPIRGIVPDEYSEDSHLVFNTWAGWAVKPCAVVNPELMEKCIASLDRVLGYLTCQNELQSNWIKDWLSYTIQHPGDKQQIAWVALGGQAVGKSFMGGVFCKALFRDLHGLVNGKLVGERFSIAPFVNRMLVFVDEARFRGQQAVDEVKLMVRTVTMNGEQKNQDARNYNIFARMIFASNRMDIGISQQDTVDRALYITKAFTAESQGMSQTEFIRWTNSLKPIFETFDKLLQDHHAVEHFMHMFINRPVTKAQVENVIGSAATDADVIMGGFSLARKVAKDLIENGAMLEDHDITTPFMMSEFNMFVTEYCKKIGTTRVQASEVFAEFKTLHMLERTADNKWRFSWKIGELHDKFGEALGVKLTPRFVFTPEDYGPNDNDGTKSVPWRGMKRYKF